MNATNNMELRVFAREAIGAMGEPEIEPVHGGEAVGGQDVAKRLQRDLPRERQVVDERVVDADDARSMLRQHPTDALRGGAEVHVAAATGAAGSPR